ncbi:hypothetical protein M8C21_000478 [Ambrosia artemisiifolia]|uniref:NAC domain-containing protein n=1 Tax=Ambrosia artemisiifolia TaxID=4212 RepID=A0AAD5DB96_AMBAR|nr:hypothetical protein M8C21_000478 [Ambrosia artemisiifolia]
MNHEPILKPPPKSSLAPGFRFHPTDEELVRYYLRRKVCRKPFRFHSLSETDVYKSEPWELADYSQLNSRDQEWYFFSPVDKKYGNGSRLNRATGQGYWKATGKDRAVHHKGQAIGSKKTLVFHVGRAPDGKRTNWVMHEYRLSDQELESAQVAQDAFVLCRIFEKSGLGPPTRDRYAPFLEEEWEDDEALFVPGGEPDEDTTNGDETRNDTVKTGTQTIDFVSKRARSEDDDGLKSETDVDPLSLLNKKSKQVDPSSSNANGSDDSATTSQDPKTTNLSSALVELSLLEPVAAKEAHPTTPPSFDASTLEKSVPPAYLKYISNLEARIRTVTTEKENLKVEVMRSQAMINVLHTRIDQLTKENKEIKSGVVNHATDEHKRPIDQWSCCVEEARHKFLWENEEAGASATNNEETNFVAIWNSFFCLDLSQSRSTANISITRGNALLAASVSRKARRDLLAMKSTADSQYSFRAQYATSASRIPTVSAHKT